MNRDQRIAIAIGMVFLVVVGCDLGDQERLQTPEPIPAGAQQVRITTTYHGGQPRGVEITLTPATVRAGETYLVVPSDTSATLVERRVGPEATPEPLTDGQIARIMGGLTACPKSMGPCFQRYLRQHPEEMKNTVQSEITSGYCDSADDPPPGVRGGTRCFQMAVNLRPGRYLVIVGQMPADGAAVLTVTP